MSTRLENQIQENNAWLARITEETRNENKEMQRRLEQIRRVEQYKKKLVSLKQFECSDKMERFLDQVDETITNFIDIMNKLDLFDPKYGHNRINCFGNILEQTLIAILDKCDRFDRRSFSKISVEYLDHDKQIELLEFWLNDGKDAERRIGKVLDNWDKNTIKNILSDPGAISNRRSRTVPIKKRWGDYLF